MANKTESTKSRSKTDRSLKQPTKQPSKRKSNTMPTALISSLREISNLTIKDLARVTGFSERSIAGWDAGEPIRPQAQRTLREIERFFTLLVKVADPKSIPDWLHTPNKAFGDLKPLEVIERGEIDRLWQMLFFLESGTPM